MFQNKDAVKELEQIASKPSKNFVFQVGNFGALESIRKNLQERIFSIEGSCPCLTKLIVFNVKFIKSSKKARQKSEPF